MSYFPKEQTKAKGQVSRNEEMKHIEATIKDFKLANGTSQEHRYGVVTPNKQPTCSRKYFLQTHSRLQRDEGESSPGEDLVPSRPCHRWRN